MRRCFVLACAAVLFLRVSPARGQAELGFGYGVYLPLGRQLVKEFGGVNGGPVPYPVLEVWQTGGPVLTLRPGYWFSPRLGLEVTVADSPSKIAIRDSLNRVGEQPAYLLMVSARAPIRLNQPSAPVVLHVSPGVALLKRGGKAWSGYGGTTDGAAVLGVGVRGLLGRRSRLWFRLELEDYVSRAQFTNARYNPTDGHLHHDLMSAIGVVYIFGRKPRPCCGR